MAMAKKQPLGLTIMCLCFGTTLLSLAIHWRITNQGQFDAPAAALSKSQPTISGIKANNSQVSIPRKTASKNWPFLTPPSPQIKVVVSLSDRRTYIYQNQEVIASYPVAIGKKDWETPTGSFRVTHMEEYPIWRHPITNQVFSPGADSPLGERWIGFWSDGRNEIGFHGTPDTHLLGSAISHGCLRMRNEDVRLFYEQVKIGTPIYIEE